ncbi:unnamed protein product, partial [Phaeothamnion confervicola]
MVSLFSAAAVGDDTAAVLADLDSQIATRAGQASFIFTFYGCEHDGQALLGFLRERFPDAAILGGTSCSGIMNESRLWGANSAGVLLIDDPSGDYGVAAAPLGDDAAATAELVLHAALADAGCPGELPELVWIYQAPGREEAVIQGLRRIVGDRCPIIGSSSADNTIAGNWRQIGGDSVLADGIVIGVLFPSGGVGCGFQGGYEPAGPSGIVTSIGFAPSGGAGTVT